MCEASMITSKPTRYENSLSFNYLTKNYPSNNGFQLK